MTMKLTNLVALYEDGNGKRAAVLYRSEGSKEGCEDIINKITYDCPVTKFTGKSIEAVKQLAFNEFWLEQETELERILNKRDERLKGGENDA